MTEDEAQQWQRQAVEAWQTRTVKKPDRQSRYHLQGARVCAVNPVAGFIREDASIREAASRVFAHKREVMTVNGQDPNSFKVLPKSASPRVRESGQLSPPHPAGKVSDAIGINSLLMPSALAMRGQISAGGATSFERSLICARCNSVIASASSRTMPSDRSINRAAGDALFQRRDLPAQSAGRHRREKEGDRRAGAAAVISVRRGFFHRFPSKNRA